MLDQVDRDLIRLLQADGRMSYVELAAQLQIGEKPVRKRIADLRSQGLIEITAVTQPQLLGYRSMAMVGLRLKGGATRSAVAEQLLDIPSVDYAVSSLGAFDVFVEVLCQDDKELGRVIDLELQARDDVADVSVFPYLRLEYQQPTWDKAQFKGQRPKEGEAAAELDKLDAQIIRILSEDGRISFQDIARQLDISESQVRKKYSKLTASGVLRVLAITNPQSLGYGSIAWLCIRALPQQSIRELSEHIAKLPFVTYLAICGGRFDILAEVICRNKEELLTLVDASLRKLDGIARVETLLCDDFFYRRVVPAVR